MDGNRVIKKDRKENTVDGDYYPDSRPLKYCFYSLYPFFFSKSPYHKKTPSGHPGGGPEPLCIRFQTASIFDDSAALGRTSP